MTGSIYDIEVESLAGEKHVLDEHRGKVLLIVNTASQCGFTPQYQGLQELYDDYRDRGLVVLGFPCNHSGNRSPVRKRRSAPSARKTMG